MKTKEIEVYLPSGVLEKDISKESQRFAQEFWADFPVKAKLIIELPEKSATISESEFEKIWREWDSSPVSLYEHLKKNLFQGKDAR